MTKRPNIVLIVTDDHAAHAIGEYGSVVNVTPRIDEIAIGGTRLDHCYCTNALCTPSRAAILTGTYSHINGVYTLDTPMDTSQETFVDSLREAGYKTAIIGKWHLGDDESSRPRGFDYYDILIDQGEYFNPRFVDVNGTREVQGYATEIITDLSLAWMEDQGDDPYCILIHHKAPHRPWEPSPKHVGMYADPIPVPATFDDDYATRSTAARHATMRIAEYLNLQDLKQLPPEGLTGDELALWKYQRYMQDYLECVASVDDNVGRVTDWLRDQKQFDDTLLMYTSDQGFFLGDHGWFDKRFMYEQSIQMPFVMSYPRRIPAGGSVDALVTNVDIAPTVLEVAGIPIPKRMQGVSFLGHAVGEDPPKADAIYYRYYEHDDAWHHAFAHYGIRTERWKLIYFYNDGLGLPGCGDAIYPPEWELYDLQADPDELNNLYGVPGFEQQTAELKTRLRQLQQELGDSPHHSDSAHNPSESV